VHAVTVESKAGLQHECAGFSAGPLGGNTSWFVTRSHSWPCLFYPELQEKPWPLRINLTPQLGPIAILPTFSAVTSRLAKKAFMSSTWETNLKPDGQSGVSKDFVMLVPIYLDLGNGRIMWLGSARVAGNNSLEQHVPLKGLKEKPKGAMLAYYDDVLAYIENH
jgi:hypothetical protein